MNARPAMMASRDSDPSDTIIFEPTMKVLASITVR